MHTRSVKVSVDSVSTWATVYGDDDSLDEVERTLEDACCKGFGIRRKPGMRGWVRKVDHLLVLPGLVLLAYPDGSYPRCVDNTEGPARTIRMEHLRECGWRPYQLDAIQAAVESPLGRGIIAAGTGAGKTRMAFGLAYVVGGVWVHVVHGIDLVRQSNAAFMGLAQATQTQLNIRSIGWSEVPAGADASGVIVDECHQCGAKGRARVLGAWRGGYRIGMSGTAQDRTDARNSLVVGLLGPVVYSRTLKELEAEGWVTPGRVRVVRL